MALAKEGREMSANLVLCSALHSCVGTGTEFCAKRPGIGREETLGTEGGKLLSTLLRGFVASFHLRGRDCTDLSPFLLGA